MKNRYFAVFAIFVLAFTFAAFTHADNTPEPVQTADLVSMLPASDGVVTLDVDRFLNLGLPRILASKPEWLAEMNSKLDELQTRSAVDLRRFQSVAIGVTAKKISASEYDYEPVIIARGKYSAGAIVALAKVASNGEYREEKVGSRTLYVFSIKDLAEKHGEKQKAKDPNDKKNGIIDKIVAKMSGEMAITALNSETLAFGTVERVRQTLAGKTRVSSEIIALLAKDPNAIARMGIKVPGGLSKFVPIDNDEIGRNIDAIRQLSGSMNVEVDSAVFKLAARTARGEQAQGLFDTLDGLVYVGKTLLGNSSRADQQLYARLLENSKLSVTGTEVGLELIVPQSDLDMLVGMIK